MALILASDEELRLAWNWNRNLDLDLRKKKTLSQCIYRSERNLRKSVRNHPAPEASLTFSDIAQNGSAPAETPPERARIAINITSPLEVYVTYENDPHLSCLSARATVQSLPILRYLAGLAMQTPVNSTQGRRHRPSGLSNIRPWGIVGPFP